MPSSSRIAGGISEAESVVNLICAIVGLLFSSGLRLCVIMWKKENTIIMAENGSLVNEGAIKI